MKTLLNVRGLVITLNECSLDFYFDSGDVYSITEIDLDDLVIVRTEIDEITDVYRVIDGDGKSVTVSRSVADMLADEIGYKLK